VSLWRLPGITPINSTQSILLNAQHLATVYKLGLRNFLEKVRQHNTAASSLTNQGNEIWNLDLASSNMILDSLGNFAPGLAKPIRLQAKSGFANDL
jgi:hypothetical protein